MSCLFCKIAQKEIKSEILFEDEMSLAFKDINPQAPTHLLIVPKRHIEKVADLTPADEPVVGRLYGVARKLAKEGGLTDYRLVVNNGSGAGQSVWHIHLHLLAGRPFSWPPG